MADTKREIERKYESEGTALPDLTGVPGVASVRDKGVAHLDATSYDTADGTVLAAGSCPDPEPPHRRIRRRLVHQVPRRPECGYEIRALLWDDLRRASPASSAPESAPPCSPSSDCAPTATDATSSTAPADLAEVSVDTVDAVRLTDGGGPARWTEIEVGLADDGDPAFLDKVEKKLRKAGARPSESASKLARALAETAPDTAAGRPEGTRPQPATVPAAAPRQRRGPRPAGRAVPRAPSWPRRGPGRGARESRRDPGRGRVHRHRWRGR
ncbi:hypothetical protein SVIOM342S_03721 [Streptomyces violaceorubidus]